MRRLIVLLLLSALLTGCMSQMTDDTQQTSPVAQPEQQGLYAPGSSVEQQTGGAVFAYPLKSSGYTWLADMGDALLLGTGADEVRLAVLTEEQCIPGGTVTLPAGAIGFHATHLGVGYYSPDDRTVVFLDKTLNERIRVTLPADAQGLPAINGETEEVLYCTANEIRGLHPETGISRLIKRLDCQSQELVGVYFHGKIFASRVTDAQGKERVVYADTQTGQTLYTAAQPLELETAGEIYLATRMDASVEQKIIGSLEAVFGQMDLDEESAAAAAILPLNAVLTYAAREGDRLSFNLYSLPDGKRSGAVELSNMNTPIAFLGDESTGCVWFLGSTDPEGNQTLYRWDPKKSPVQDDAVCIRPLVTADAPDTEKIARCQARAEKLNRNFGIDIRIWQDAVAENGDLVMTLEYQSALIDDLLDGLESILALFPREFLQRSAGGNLHICLVRDIPQETSAQYWQSGEPYIVLTSGCDVAKEFLNQIGYVIDTHVLNNSVAYDAWDSLNPKGFTYDRDYARSEARPDSEYLEGDKRAFLDKRCMSFPTEDRSRIFACAMSEDCAEFFTSATMQRKLRQVCLGIRQAFGLTKDRAVFPWEQYLEESLAYQGKEE